MSYSSDEPADRGFTWFLAQNPGVVVRKNDVPDPDEKGVPKGFPKLPSNKYREVAASSDTDHRRFLGVAVATKEFVGVIRVVRAPERRPFTTFDESVLSDIANKCLGPALDTHRDEVLKLLAPTGDRQSLPRAVALLARPVANLSGATRRRANDILQAVVTLFRHEGHKGTEIVASFHVLHRHDGADALALYECHSSKTQECSTHRHIPLFELGDAAARDAIYGRDMIGCDWGPRILQSADGELGWQSQAVVPVVAWGAGEVLRGILTVAVGRRVRWESEQLQLLQLASQGLAAIMSVLPEARPTKISDARIESYYDFVRESQDILRAEWCELASADQDGRVIGTGERGRASYEWIPLGFPESERQDSPVMVSRGRDALRVPLFIGANDAGMLTAGTVWKDDGAEVKRRIGIVRRQWSQVTAEPWAGWSARFIEGTARGSIRRWQVEIALDLKQPSEPGRM